MADQNELLGEFQLAGIPPAPAGTPQIEVTFNIDENGIVNVEAEDKGSGNAESITIEGGAGLSDEQIEQMKEEAEEHAEEDKLRREFVEARNDAEGSVRRAETLLEENEEQISEDLKEDIEAAVGNVEDVLEEYSEDVDPSEFEEATDAFEQATETLAQELQEIGKQMYDQQAQQAAAGGAGPGGAAGGPGGAGPGGAGPGAEGAAADGEEYVDADYEDVDEDE
jgi:molecular chaperone DnaK